MPQKGLFLKNTVDTWHDPTLYAEPSHTYTQTMPMIEDLLYLLQQGPP